MSRLFMAHTKREVNIDLIVRKLVYLGKSTGLAILIQNMIFR